MLWYFAFVPVFLGRRLGSFCWVCRYIRSVVYAVCVSDKGRISGFIQAMGQMMLICVFCNGYGTCDGWAAVMFSFITSCVAVLFLSCTSPLDVCLRKMRVGGLRYDHVRWWLCIRLEYAGLCDRMWYHSCLCCPAWVAQSTFFSFSLIGEVWMLLSLQVEWVANPSLFSLPCPGSRGSCLHCDTDRRGLVFLFTWGWVSIVTPYHIHLNFAARTLPNKGGEI